MVSHTRKKNSIIFIWIYCLLLIASLVIGLVNNSNAWAFSLFDWIAPLSLGASVFILIYTLRLKQWMLTGILGVITLASLWNVKGLWTSRVNELPKSGKTYVVMTHNAGNGLATSQELVEVLRSSGADIIGLQEINSTQVRAINQNLSDVYPYRILFGNGIPGKGLLSKFPIVEYQQLNLYPDRPDLRASIQLLDGKINVIVAHPPPPRIHSNGIYMNTATISQIETLLDLATTGEPVVMLGDFNMTSRSTQHEMLRSKGLVDAFQAAGQGLGFTLPMRYKNVPLLPMARVDYIWHSNHLTSIDSWIGSHTGSDHLPVLARIRWDLRNTSKLQ